MRTKVTKVGPARARVKSAKVRPTPYVYYPPVEEVRRHAAKFTEFAVLE